MSIPRVFVSSTYYDLRLVREEIESFIREDMGYEPVLSEQGTVFFDTSQDVRDACVEEVGRCQMFVLIIGGRSGASHTDGSRSVTNAEYDDAIARGVPVFSVVDEHVLTEFGLYKANRSNIGVDNETIVYPSVDSTKVFQFIDKVQSAPSNNALHPFTSIDDIKVYLRRQWAALLSDALSGSSKFPVPSSAQPNRHDFEGTLRAMAAAVDRIDPSAAGHSERVTQHAGEIARALEMSDAMTETIKMAAALHDIGKIGAADAVLTSGRLTDTQITSLRQHSVVGADILSKVSEFRDAAMLTLFHHEWYGGGGYPTGVSGETIPLGARIIAVADIYDALVTERSYRSACSPDKAAEQLVKASGTQLDPEVVNVFLALLSKQGILAGPDHEQDSVANR